METYHILNYRGLPLRTVGVLCFGLRNDSRIKMKLANINYTLSELLMAKIVDNTALTAWLQTKDAVDGANKPQSFFNILVGNESIKSEYMTFENPEDFLKAFNEITER